MREIVFDIETSGCDWDALDSGTKEYLKLKNDGEKGAMETLGLSPLTGMIITLSMLDTEKKTIETYFTAKKEDLFSTPAEESLGDFKTKFYTADEPEILNAFWLQIKSAGRFITFNGLKFDCPYITLRSAYHKIPATRNINTNRFRREEHYDLFDALSLYGAVKGSSLEMYCKSFGIMNPKEEGISGKNVGEYFKKGLYGDIAKYCARDVFSTYMLYKRIKDYF